MIKTWGVGLLVLALCYIPQAFASDVIELPESVDRYEIALSNPAPMTMYPEDTHQLHLLHLYIPAPEQEITLWNPLPALSEKSPFPPKPLPVLHEGDVVLSRIAWWESQDENTSISLKRRFFRFLAGRPAPNQLHLGMWSQHFGTETHYNQVHKLIGFQYKGIFAGTFINSHDMRTYGIGIARTLFSKKIKRFEYRLGYKIAPLYGYHTKAVPNLYGFTLFPAVVNSFQYRHIGIDVSLVPGNAIGFNFNVFP